MLAPLRDKWASFGWDACEIDGHDVGALAEAMQLVPNGSGKPVAFIAHTVKGKGVSFMEDDNNWHYRAPTAEEVVHGAQGARPRMRNAFADELTKLGDDDPRVVMLSGDIGNRLFDTFKANHPQRFFNCGVAEANMTGLAAGLAMNGLRPVTYTITPFVTTRCLEQIRTDVCYHEVPVTIVAVGAGLCLCRARPDAPRLRGHRLPARAPEHGGDLPGRCAWRCARALRAAMQQDRPAYIRMGKKGEPMVHAGPLADFAIGKAITISRATTCACCPPATMLPEAMEAAQRLGRARPLRAAS